MLSSLNHYFNLNYFHFLTLKNINMVMLKSIRYVKRLFPVEKEANIKLEMRKKHRNTDLTRT
jgi:hypothetical protein